MSNVDNESTQRLSLRMLADTLDVLVEVYPKLLSALTLYEQVFGNLHKGMDDDPDWLINVKFPLDKQYDFNLNFLMEQGYIHGFNKRMFGFRRMTNAPSWDTPKKCMVEGAEYVEWFRATSQGILYRETIIFPQEECTDNDEEGCENDATCE